MCMDDILDTEEVKINNKDDIKKKYINYYKDQLFELCHGCWVIKNDWTNAQIQIYDSGNINIESVPIKVYKLYYELPINIENIINYKLFLDGREIDKFDNNILLNEYDIPREYIILIYLKDNKYPICYEYCFSFYSQTIFKQNVGYNINLINKKLMNEKEQMVHFEAQIFILQNL